MYGGDALQSVTCLIPDSSRLTERAALSQSINNAVNLDHCSHSNPRRLQISQAIWIKVGSLS